MGHLIFCANFQSNGNAPIKCSKVNEAFCTSSGQTICNTVNLIFKNELKLLLFVKLSCSLDF